jgi:effector-binding domain-containing protein
MSSYHVHVQKVEPQPIAAVRRRAAPGQLAKVVPEACGEVWKFVRAAGIPHPGCHIALYLDGEINLEVGVIVPDPFTATGPVVCSATPGGTVVTTAHFGPYQRLGDAHRTICEWCAERGYRTAGPNWEVYGHWKDEWNDDPSKIRTDVFYLLHGDVGPEPSR